MLWNQSRDAFLSVTQYILRGKPHRGKQTLPSRYDAKT